MSCSKCDSKSSSPYQQSARPSEQGPCIQLTRCNLTRQQVNGLINKLNTLRATGRVPQHQINEYMGIALSALNAKNICHFYIEVQEALDFVKAYV